ncbi:MAG: carboxyl transferase domain-containing protein, partial [Actinomycetota bacterium]
MTVDHSPIDDVEAARAAQLDEARPEAVDAVHRAGRLTARERLAALLDPDSEVPYGTIAAVAADGAWVAEGGGVDAIGAVDGVTVIASSTDFTDKGGGYGAGRLERLFPLAHEHRWPVVLFVDTMAMVGTQPDSSAMPSKSMNRPKSPLSSRSPRSDRGCRARLPPPSTKSTTGQRCS